MTGPRVTFAFTVRDGSPYCRFDSAQFEPCESPFARNLSAGVHSFTVQAMNSAGGIDSDSRLWSVVCATRDGGPETFALYHMDEGSGTVVANAHSYYVPPAPPGDARFKDPPNDPQWTSSGRFGGGLRFSAQGLSDTDGILGTPLLPPEASSLGAHSIEMWVNPAPTFPHELVLLRQGGGTQTGRMDYSLTFSRIGGQGTFTLSIRSGATSTSLVSPLVDLGVFHYVAFAYEPGTAPLLFVDGWSSRVSQTIDGTVEMWVFNALSPYEGDVDDVHLTMHPYSEAELLEQWCPPM